MHIRCFFVYGCTGWARRNDNILNDCHSVNFGHNEMK